MKPNVVLFAVLASVVLFAAPLVCAQTGEVLFYESSKVGKNYRIGSGYSALYQALRDKGYSVERYEGTLTRADLDNYDPDVLVIAGLEKPLEADELAAVFEFVMQKGRGLLIIGGTSAANQITIPFGMAVDEAGTLEDETSKIVSNVSADKKAGTKFFVVSTITRDDDSLRLVVDGVSKLAFFEGNGISVSGDAKVVASGDEDTYSPKSSTFPKNSRPPVASAVLVGNGMVLLLSDPDMFANERVDAKKYKYDNLRFGTNIIDWLRSSTLRPSKDNDVAMLGVIQEQRLEEITELNASIKETSSLLKDKNTEVQELTEEKTKLLADTAVLKESKFMGIAHLHIGLIMLAISGLALFLVVSKAKKKDKKTDSAGGLGYEFDSGGAADPTDAFSAKSESFDEAMGMEKK